jgi:hypothetical protein
MDFRTHPPERRRRGTVLAVHGCCCCCCCCLHTMGGLIAVAVEGTKTTSPEARRTVRVYWWILLATSALGVASFTVKEHIGIGLLALLMGFPLAQLNASFLTLLASMFTPIDLRMLGRLTWKGLLWGAIGFLVMAVPFMIMTYR